MLKELSIQNYALIDNLKLDFSSGFSVMTGETGSGKSIIIGALGLVLGERADFAALKEKKDKCIVEATFAIEGYPLQPFFEKHELDYDQLTIIRREITSSGKSRAFINDTPVNLTQLKELGSFLIDIHSQHQTLSLNQQGFQTAVLDAFCGNEKLLKDYHKVFYQYREEEKKLLQLKEEEHKSQSDLDYYQFLYKELAEANLREGEEESLEEELGTLQNAEEIKEQLSFASSAVGEEEHGALSMLQKAKQSLMKLEGYNKHIDELRSRLESVLIELEDVDMELSGMDSFIEYDPEKIRELDDRFNLLQGLFQKHHVNTCKKLINIREELDAKISGVGSIEEEIARSEKQLDELKRQLDQMADLLYQARTKAAPGLEDKVQAILKDLAMPDAKLNVAVEQQDEFSLFGKDKVVFMFRANKGGAFNPLNKTASGGELSRLMLSVKAIVAGLKENPTIIFDEIDTGVSGDVADKIGNIMAAMSKDMQLITITHLPQIASKAGDHYKVFKEVLEEQTYTRIKKLNEDERLHEIAKMLSGEKLSGAAIENARVLLGKVKA